MKNNIALVFVILAAVALTAILLLWPGPEKGSVAESGEGIKAIVSILPQKEFVRSVGGNHVSVKELIPPGASPATYDLSPQDLVAIEDADIYFRIGHIPFEKSHLEKIGDINPGLVIVDTSESVPLRGFGGEEAHDHEEGLHGNEEEEVHIHEGADPHIWLSPALVKLQVESIYDALAKEDPANVEEYRANADAYLERLDSLDSGLEGAFKDVGTDVLMVFHPAWGYFADAYGLEQIAIEKEGKEPTASELRAIIDIGREKGVKVIFVQAQFDKSIAESMAEELGAVVIQIDPLAEDYIENLGKVGGTISANLQ